MATYRVYPLLPMTGEYRPVAATVWRQAIMCRWAAYLGEPVFLEEIVTAPCHC